MRKKGKNLVSIIITMALLFQQLIMPIMVYAEPLEKEADKVEEAKEIIVSELEELREENIKHFFKSDNTYEAVVYPTRVHYLDGDKYVDIDNTLEESKDLLEDVFENKDNDFKVKFAKNTRQKYLYKLTKDEYEISLSMKGEKDSLGKRNIKVAAFLDGLSINEKKKTLVNLTDEIKYENIFDGIDFNYTITPDGVKEDIIINKEGKRNEFVYELEAKNLNLELENNIIIFKGANNNEVFKLKAPYMYDANGEMSNDIKLDLEEDRKGYKITLTASKEWLDSGDRAYPVVIDPIITTDVTPAQISDAHVSEGFATTNYSNSYLFKTGYGSSSHKNRTYLAFELPTLTTGDMVTHAELNLSLAATASYQRQVNAHKVSSSWSESTITWNNKPSYDETVIDYQRVTGNALTFDNWDITPIVKEWYLSDTNNGLMIKNEDESAGYTEYYPADTSGTYENYRPIVVINYVNNTGLESYWTYHSQSIGRSGTGYINDYNGNLIFVHNDLSESGSRLPISVNHVYNSNNKSIDYGYGKGWNINYNQSIVYKTLSGINYYKYIDEDGTEIYLRDQGSGIYKDDLGLNLTLTVDAANSEGKYILRDKKDNKLIFDNTSLNLKIIKDNLDNEINITYNSDLISTIEDGSGRVTNLYYTDSKLSSIVSPDNKTTKYYYNNADSLIKVEYPDGEFSSYMYDALSNITNVKDIDNRTLSYEYYSKEPYRVKKVSENYNQYTLSNFLYDDNSVIYDGINAATRIEGTTEGFEYLLWMGSDASRFDNTYLNTNVYNSAYVGAKYQNDKWYYDDNDNLVEFTPNDDDRVIGHFYKHTTSGGITDKDLYLSNDDKINGVNIGGSYTGNFEINKKSSTACVVENNDGEFKIASGTFTHPNGNTYSAGCGTISTRLETASYNTGYVMFVGTDMSRFYDRYNNLSSFVFVKYYNAEWVYDDNGYGWESFTPNANDSVVGVLHRNTSTTGITEFDSWLGENNKVHGIKISSNFSDSIEINKNYRGLDNPGEIRFKKGNVSFEDTKNGMHLSMEYGDNETKFTDYEGNDNFYQFNDSGNTILVKDSLGRAQYYKYDASNANELDTSSTLQETTVNHLKDHSTESGGVWYQSVWSPSAGSTSHSTDDAYIGNKSLKVTKTNTDAGHFMRQVITLEKGKTYTYSYHVKSTDLSDTGTGGIMMMIYTKDSSGSWKSRYGTTLQKADYWQENKMTFTVPSDATDGDVIIQVGMHGETGTAYFDNMQVEEDVVVNRYNLVENGDFNFGSGTPDLFTKTGTVSSGDAIATNNHGIDILNTDTYKINGVANQAKGLKQTINVSGSTGDSFVFSGWSKADSISLNKTSPDETRKYGIEVTVNHSDGSNNKKYVSFNDDSSYWQYLSDVIIADETYNSVSYELLYNYNENAAYFDGLALYKDNFGVSYTYDSDGNVTAVKSVDNNETSFAYTNDDLTSITTSENNEYKYEYDPNHKLTKMTTPSNITSSFTYDQYGNLTKTKVEGASLFIEGYLEYDSTGNYVVKKIDSRGNVINYDYDTFSGNINSVTDPNENITSYTYDSLNRLSSVSKDSKTINYTYNNDYLEEVTANGITYKFIYDELGNQTEVEINNNTLIERNYEIDNGINTGRLDSVDYGNGDSVESIFDSLDRVIELHIDGTKKFEYKYDNSNFLVEAYDVDNDVTTYYDYDLIGRLVKVNNSEDDEVRFVYNDKNKIEQIIEKYDDIYYSTTYTFDAENRITNMQFHETPDLTNIEFFPLAGNLNSLSGINPITNSSTFTEDEVGNTVLDADDSPNSAIKLGVDKSSGSYGAWIKPTTGTTYRAIIGNQLPSTSFLTLFINPSGNLELRTKNNSDATYALVESTSTVPTGQWIFVGCKWSLGGSTLSADIFINDTKYSNTTTDFKDFSGINYTSFGTNYSAAEDLEGLISDITYSKDALTDTQFDDLYEAGRGKNISYAYDDLGRLETKKLYTNSVRTEETYTYASGANGSGTALIDSVNQKLINSADVTVQNETTSYEYDKLGNITKITYPDANTSEYTYDALNQLLTEKHSESDEKISYEYEGIGNIKKVTVEDMSSAGTSSTDQYRYITADGTFSNWTDYTNLTDIDHSVNLNKIPNIGTLGSMYDLYNNNVSYSIVDGMPNLDFNGTTSKASSRDYLEFNGSSTKVSLPTINVASTDEITITARVYWDGGLQASSVDGRGSIVTLGASYYLQLRSNGHINVYTMPDSGESVYDSSANPIPKNQWVDIAFTESNGLRKIYINGELDSTSQRESTIRSVTSNTEIGIQGSSRHFNGNISEISIWDKDLTETEIENINSNGLAGNESNLKAYYTFDETSSELIDKSSNNNDGLIIGANYKRPEIESETYFTFDGDNDAVELPQIDVSDTNKVTLVAKIYWDGSNQDSGGGADRGTIITKNMAYYMQLTDAGQIAVYTYTASGGSSYDYSSVIPENQWVDVAFSEENGMRRIYINGELDTSSQKEVGIRNDTNYTTMIGKEKSTNHRSFNGKIAHAAIFDRDLSISEIRSINKHGLNGDEIGLEGYYTFDGDDQTVIDHSSNNRDGTVINAKPSLTNTDDETYLEFNGVDSIIEMPEIYVSDTDQVTLTAKIYWDGSNQDSGAGTDRGTIIAKNMAYYMQLTDDGKIAVYTYTDSTSSTYDYSVASIPRNQWVDVAFTEVAGLRKIYINGTLSTSSQKESGIRNDSNYVTTIGNQQNTNHRVLNAKIADASIWDRALTSTEINDIITNGIDGDETNLEAHYTFVGAGSVLTDYSGNNQDGKIYNTNYPNQQTTAKSMYLEIDLDTASDNRENIIMSFNDHIDSYINYDLSSATKKLDMNLFGNHNIVNLTNPLTSTLKTIIRWNGSTYDVIVNGTKITNTAEEITRLLNINNIKLGAGMNDASYADLIANNFVLSSKEITEQDALDVTDGTKNINEVLTKTNSEIVYNFIEFRQVSNDTNLTQLEELDYTYDTSWKDQLTEYEGYEYTYDEIGNPTLIEKDGVTYQTFTWEKGRQLENMYIKRDHLGEHDLDIYYKYNDNGIRTEKKVVDKTTLVETITTYKVQGNKIIEEQAGSDKIHYIYDAEGSVVAFKYYEDTYYYKRNITGDIIGIIDATGAQVVTYKYNSWGEIESITDTSSNDIGTVNRVRYKGYYYDSETKLYYLNSRYYNPETKRMLNADGILGQQGNIVGHNMYAYAGNNPIMYIDSNGYWFKLTEAIARGIWKIGSYILNKVADLNNTKKMLDHSLQDEPTDLYFGPDSEMVEDIKTSSVFKTKMGEIAKEENKTFNFDDKRYELKFTNGDLQASLQNASMMINGKMKNGTGNLNIIIYDTYDFKLEPIPFNRGIKDFGLIVANNLAWLDQVGGAINSYDVQIYFDYCLNCE